MRLVLPLWGHLLTAVGSDAAAGVTLKCAGSAYAVYSVDGARAALLLAADCTIVCLLVQSNWS
jgi:hypothetical protein